jgi:hypothetical protein
MKVKGFIWWTVVAAVGASSAVASPPAGKGKPAATGAGCKPSISVILRGTLAGGGGTAPFALPVNVTGGNKFATAFEKATQPLSVSVSADTKVRRQGDRNAAALKSGDVVNIRARVCKADLANGAAPALTAVRVTAHAPGTKADGQSEND